VVVWRSMHRVGFITVDSEQARKSATALILDRCASCLAAPLPEK